MSETGAPEVETYEDEDDYEYARMDTEIVYEYSEGNIRNYLEIGVDAGADSASLYFEGRDDSGEIQAGYQYLDADELQELIAAAEKALATIQANS